MGAFVMPSTLLRLLSLGEAVISVAEVFSELVPFSVASVATCQKYLGRIRAGHALPLATVAVRARLLHSCSSQHAGTACLCPCSIQRSFATRFRIM